MTFCNVCLRVKKQNRRRACQASCLFNSSIELHLRCKGPAKKRALFLRRFFAFQAHGLLRDDFSQRKIVSREIKFHTPKIFLNFFSVFFSQSRKSRLISPSRLKLINVWRRLTNQSWMALIQVWLRSTGGSYKMDTRWTTNVDDEDRLTKATYQGPPPKPPPPIRMFWIAW